MITKESKLLWTPISTQVKQIHPFSIKVTEIELQDRLFDIGPLTAQEGDIFDIKELPTRSYEVHDPSRDVQIRISFERDLSLTSLERTAYGILDMLGDIGGLFDALLVIGAALVGLI